MEAIPSKLNSKGLREVDDEGGLVGDVPHGWVASHYILLIRDMILREEPGRLILFSAIPDRWLANGKYIEIKDAPTFFGKTDVKLTSAISKGYLTLQLKRPSDASFKGYTVKSPLGKPVKKVMVDGAGWKNFTGTEIKLPVTAKEVTIHY